MTTPIKTTFPSVMCITQPGSLIGPIGKIPQVEEEKFPPRDRMFDLGQVDRVRGMPCRSANGKYLNGWYAVPNPKRS